MGKQKIWVGFWFFSGFCTLYTYVRMFLILKIRRSWHFPIKNAQSYSKYAAKSAGVASRVASRVVQGGVHLFND